MIHSPSASPPLSILILGAGAWGGALACVFARAGHRVSLWDRKPQDLDDGCLKRLPGIRLPSGISLTADLPKNPDVILAAVPTQTLRDVLQKAGSLPGQGVPVILCCKGLEQKTSLLPAQIAAAIMPKRLIGALSGPTFAAELAAEKPAAAVLAFAEMETARLWCHRLTTPNFRLYPSADLLGVELGGAAKNVIAIGAGVAIGSGMGENTRAAIITRGLGELRQLAQAIGAEPATVTGLSGLGDLVLTATGGQSRNYTLGLELGRGRKLSAILKEREAVTEGVFTAPALLAFAKSHGLGLPVITAIANLLDGKRNLNQIRADLLQRPLRPE